jgi:tetratricopeptide (TPR) repeat protein
MQDDRAPTPDDLGELISRSDALLADARIWQNNLLELLFLRDRMEELAEHFESRDIDVTPQRNAMHTLDGVLRHRRSTIARELRRPNLTKARADRKPPPHHWWWYLDHILEEERRRRFLRWLAVGAAVVLVLSTVLLIVNELTKERSAVNAHLLQAKSLYLEGNYAAALEEAQSAVEVIPNNPTSHLWLSIIYRKLEGGESQGEAAFERATELHQNVAASHLERGLIYLELGDNDASWEDAEETLRLAPEWAQGYVLVGNLYIEEGNLEEARVAVEKAIEYSEDDAATQVLAKMQLVRVLEAIQVEAGPPRLEGVNP